MTVVAAIVLVAIVYSVFVPLALLLLSANHDPEKARREGRLF